MQESLNNQSKVNGRWTHQQHLSFLQGLRIYGKNWKKIQQLVPSRSGTQIRSHAQKFFMKANEEQRKNMLHNTAVGNMGNTEANEQESFSEHSKGNEGVEYKRECSSYYLNKILEHSTGFGLSDFWDALIDCKQQSENKETSAPKHSFDFFEKQAPITDEHPTLKQQ